MTIKIIKKAFHALFFQPWLFLPALAFLILSELILLFFQKVMPVYTSTLAQTIITILFSLLMLFISSYTLTSLITASFISFTKRASLSNLIPKSFHVLKNALVLLILLLASSLIKLIAYYGAGIIGTSLQLSVKPAQAIFFFIYFLGLLFLLFLTYTSFFVVQSKPIFQSIRKSISFTKRNYLFTLSLAVISFVLSSLLSLFNQAFADIITTLLITPIFIIILAYLTHNDI